MEHLEGAENQDAPVRQHELGSLLRVEDDVVTDVVVQQPLGDLPVEYLPPDVTGALGPGIAVSPSGGAVVAPR